MRNKEFDAALSAAARSVWSDRAAAFDAAPNPAVTHSPDFADNVAAIFEKKTPKRIRPPFFILKRVAAAVCVLLVFTFVIMLPAIPGLIDRFLNSETPSENVTVLDYSLNEEKIDGDEKTLCKLNFVSVSEPEEVVRPSFVSKKPVYLPASGKWSEKVTKRTGSCCKTVYKSAEGKIVEIYQAYAGKSVVSVFTDYLITERKIGGFDGFVITYNVGEDSYYSVYFTDGVYEYFVDTNYKSEETVVTIAESVIPTQK